MRRSISRMVLLLLTSGALGMTANPALAGSSAGMGFFHGHGGGSHGVIGIDHPSHNHGNWRDASGGSVRGLGNDHDADDAVIRRHGMRDHFFTERHEGAFTNCGTIGGSGLPPGLQMQLDETGHLPPGLEMQAEEGRFPPGLEKRLQGPQIASCGSSIPFNGKHFRWGHTHGRHAHAH